SELPSAVRPSGSRGRCQGPTAAPLPTLPDAARNLAGPAATGTVPAPRTQRRQPEPGSRGGQRHRSRAAHASRETEVVRADSGGQRRAVEMTVEENPLRAVEGNSSGKDFPRPWKAHKTRFPHSHRPGGCYDHPLPRKENQKKK